jgi:hypothetical protein
MYWKRVKKGVPTLLAVLSVKASSANKIGKSFSGPDPALSRRGGRNCAIRPFYFLPALSSYGPDNSA